MFDKNYEDRLRSWLDFRNALETSNNPLQNVIDQYNKVPQVSRYTDPWTPEMWPSPWELIEENQYCEFCKILGICYSLQLTDKFSQSSFEIHIAIDNEESSTYYLLYVDDQVIGYQDDTYVHKSELPPTLQSHRRYPMPKLQ